MKLSKDLDVGDISIGNFKEDFMKYYYRVYGVNIESKIEVPEFEVIDSNSDIDVKLSFGVVNEEIIDLITQGYRAK